MQAGIPTKTHEHARMQCQHPGIEDGLHADANIDPERLTEPFGYTQDMRQRASTLLATSRSAKILREKPIRPMHVLLRARVTFDECRKSIGLGRRRAQFPPLLEDPA